MHILENTRSYSTLSSYFIEYMLKFKFNKINILEDAIFAQDPEIVNVKQVATSKGFLSTYHQIKI